MPISVKFLSSIRILRGSRIERGTIQSTRFDNKNGFSRKERKSFRDLTRGGKEEVFFVVEEHTKR